MDAALIGYLATAGRLLDRAAGPGHELELHPLLAIFTLMVGGAVGGLAGAYLSLPIAAAVRVIWRQLARNKQWLPVPK